MSRPAATAVVVLGALALALAAWWWWPSRDPALPCAPSEVVLDAQGVARCGPLPGSRPLPAGQALTVGQRLDLNSATAEELAQIPNIGPELGRALVEERRRRGGFHSWDDVAAVNGVGPARLARLRESAEIREVDAGLW